MNITLDQLLVMLASGLLSLGFSYLPKLKDWYDTKTPTEKRGIMALCLLGVAAAFFGLACAGWLSGLSERFGIPVVTCDWVGVVDLVVAYVLALGANQGVYWVIGNKKPRRA